MIMLAYHLKPKKKLFQLENKAVDNDHHIHVAYVD